MVNTFHVRNDLLLNIFLFKNILIFILTGYLQISKLDDCGVNELCNKII